MRITPVKTPVIAKKAFPNYLWNVETTEKELYLTFDDGPTPEITEWTLDVLETYSARATFFCIGANIDKYPEIFNKILHQGHAIGNHTQHHIKGWKTNTVDYLTEVKTTEATIRSYAEIIQCRKLFRPPYGQIKSKQGKAISELGYEVVMWDVLSFDWDQSISAEQCLNNVKTKSKPGSIIVFHDSVKASKNMMATLPQILKEFSDQGYIFKALD